MIHVVMCPRCDRPMDQAQRILPGGAKEVTARRCFKCGYEEQDSPRIRDSQRGKGMA